MPYMQVGIKALRAPNGDFLPAVPIFKEIPDSEIKKSGLTAEEERSADWACKVIYKLYAEHKRSLERKGVLCENTEV
jgi:hypothetical protein